MHTHTHVNCYIRKKQSMYLNGKLLLSKTQNREAIKERLIKWIMFWKYLYAKYTLTNISKENTK